MADHFGTYSQYYDLLYQDKDYQGEVDYVQGLLSKYGRHAHDVLEFGCGTGRHAELFARVGYAVTGVELSKSMLQQSVSRAERLRLSGCRGIFEPYLGDVRSFRTDRKFDAVLSLFHVVSYQTSNDDVSQTFASAATHLKPTGLFLFDVWYGPAVLSMKPTVRIKRMHNDQIEVVRIAEPNIDMDANRVDVHYTIFVTDKTSNRVTQLSETHPMRYYFTPELELLAKGHNLSVLHSEEWMTSNAPSEHTWGVTFVVQKAAAR